MKEVNNSDNKEDDIKIDRRPLLLTTSRGNSWTLSSPYELMMLNPSQLMQKFVDGTEPVTMGYLLTGKFKSSFPEGIEIEVETGEGESSEKSKEAGEEMKT